MVAVKAPCFNGCSRQEKAHSVSVSLVGISFGRRTPGKLVLTGPLPLSTCSFAWLFTTFHWTPTSPWTPPNHIKDTTRKPRPGEEHGKHYWFVTREEFLKLKEEDGFVETAEFAGNLYGTSKEAVRTLGKQGKVCVLDIELQGVKSIKNTDLGPKYVFIMPPSLEILESRLRGRQTDTEEAIQKRLAAAKLEIDYAKQPGTYDMVLVNDDLAQTTAILLQWIDENYYECQ